MAPTRIIKRFVAKGVDVMDVNFSATGETSISIHPHEDSEQNRANALHGVEPS